MITVVCWDGSEAEAETPEGALLAGRTLWDEALAYARAGGLTGYPVINFYVAGEHVRSCNDRTQLEAL